MNISEIWSVIEPYCMAVLSFLSSGAVGAILGNLVAKRVTRRFDISAMTAGVAEKLAGSKLNVDVKAVTEKQLDEFKKIFKKQLDSIDEKINIMLTYQGDTMSCISSSAKLKKEESDKLIANLESIKQATTPITVKDEICIEILPTEPQQACESVKNSLLKFD